MADETVINGEFSDDRAVEITEDEVSSKISSLTTKISDLEREKSNTIRENDGYKKHIEEMMATIRHLTDEFVDLKKQVEETESENKAMGSVAARAAELEADVSRLQHDLISTESDLQELSYLKKDLEEVKDREKEKDVKLNAVAKERDLLLAKIEKLERAESNSRIESEGKEEEILVLTKNIEDLKVIVENGKCSEKLKNELEKEIKKLKSEISTLQNKLKEKENGISEFQMEDIANGGLRGGDDLTECEKKIIVKGFKQKDYVVIGGTALAAVALMGAVCYVHARKS